MMMIYVTYCDLEFCIAQMVKNLPAMQETLH